MVSSGARTIVDSGGVTWRVTEEALVPGDGSAALARIPTNNAFWFGWFSNNPTDAGVSRFLKKRPTARRPRTDARPCYHTRGAARRAQEGRHGRRCPD